MIRPTRGGEPVSNATPCFGTYERRIRDLPAHVQETDVLTPDFLLAREGRLEVFYAPLHGVTAAARVVVVGLTPGRSQMLVAFREGKRLLDEGWRPPRLFEEIRRLMAFAGPMRKNLTRMLDEIGVADRLGIATSEELFGGAATLLHSTSALRYPVLKARANYSGSPRVSGSPLLAGIVRTNLAAELEQFPGALVVPLGKAVEEAIGLVGVDRSQVILSGFPHPSGGNGHRVRQFKAEYQQLRSKVRRWGSHGVS